MNMNQPTTPLTTAVAATLLFAAAPLAATEADDRLIAAFAQTHTAKSLLKDDAVHVAVKDGVLTLSGTVGDASRRVLAQETAAHLPGVIRVENQLAISGDVAVVHSDAWVAGKVRLALLFHRQVSASRIAVAVRDGVVTLTGTTDNLAQRELTVAYARDVDGVRSVTDAMTVLPMPAAEIRSDDAVRDDASISAQLKVALALHRSTSAVQTVVETRQGVVHLTGIAANAAEKALVGKLAADIPGVSEVQNQMTVRAALAK